MASQTFTIACSDGTKVSSILRIHDPGWPPEASAVAGAWNLMCSCAGTVYGGDITYLRFDTSGLLDDCVVTAASLRFTPNSFNNVNSRNLRVDWKLSGSWYPGDPADWVEPSGVAASVALSTFTPSVEATVVLAGAAANVSKTGNTGLVLGIGPYTAPTGLNDLPNGGTPFYLDVTYTLAGYQHKVLGCLPATIAKIMGIPTANVAKFCGV